MNNSNYITTTIPYVNAAPHIGFACELVQADAIARYRRLQGSQVRFQTGTDENAFKNVLSAREQGIPVQQLVTQNSARFAALCDTLNISQDKFVRTSSAAHHGAVQTFLGRLRTEDVYRQEYRGLYCAGCEDFFLERDLTDGLCPDHRTPVTEIAEHNYFFRLRTYEAQLHELITSRRIRIVPETREQEVLRFIERGLTDISLSRDAQRSGGWGVPFPNDRSQVVYVWIDALVNYLSGLDSPDGNHFEAFWNSGGARLHVIGKNVWKFHAIYWPALLLSAGLEVPDTIFVHGFLTSEGKKISKSSGNAPDPVTYVHAFGADAVRYFLLRHIHPFEDTDFTVSRLAEVYDADLSNGLGNLCSRLTTLCESAQVAVERTHETPAGLIHDTQIRPTDEIQTKPTREILDRQTREVPALFENFHDHIAAFRIDLALEVLWAEVRQLNQLLSTEKPWEAIKAGRVEEAQRKLKPVIARLDAVAYWLQPFLPDTAARITEALSGPVSRKVEPLFPRRAA